MPKTYDQLLSSEPAWPSLSAGAGAAPNRVEIKLTSRTHVSLTAVGAQWTNSAEVKRELAVNVHGLLDRGRSARQTLLAESARHRAQSAR